MELIEARVAAHYNYVLVSMPPYKYVKAACMSKQVREAEYRYCLHEVDGYINRTHPLVFAAKANYADMPNFWQAMNQPDAHLFMKAIQVEVDQMNKLDAWELIDESKVAFVSGVRCNVIESTWAFTVKRTPDGAMKKQKARLCVRSDQQVKDVDYFEAFALVVSWIIVPTIMTLAVTLGLKSQQVDYTNMFIQATLPPGEEVYMSLPRGWEQPGKVLRLKKSVYGLAQALFVWFNKLKQGLEDTGFRSSSMDPCLFISDKVICIVYVYDCLMFARDIEDVDAAIQKILNIGFQL
eukprot:9002732-Ditylum_brightwellii.AAC.1